MLHAMEEFFLCPSCFQTLVREAGPHGDAKASELLRRHHRVEMALCMVFQSVMRSAQVVRFGLQELGWREQRLVEIPVCARMQGVEIAHLSDPCDVRHHLRRPHPAKKAQQQRCQGG